MNTWNSLNYIDTIHSYTTGKYSETKSHTSGLSEESSPICAFRYIPVNGIFSQTFREEANVKQGSSERKQEPRIFICCCATHKSCVEVSYLLLALQWPFIECSACLRSCVSRVSLSPEIGTSSINWVQTSMIFFWGRRQNPVTETLLRIETERMIISKKSIIVLG
jgi:hypothetical protein